MKKLILALLGIAFLNTNNFAQTADEIIEKSITARGGREKLKSLESITMEAKVNANGMEIPMVLTTVKNKGFKLELNIMGMNCWIITRPDSGWMFMPIQGQTKPEAMPADALKESADQLDIEGLDVNYKEKGHTVEYLGLDDVEGTDCHKLKITTKKGTVHYELIDPKSFLTVRTISKATVGGKEMENQTDLSNYKEVEGLMFPFNITSGNGPMEITKITLNAKVDENKFMPAN